MRRNYKHNIIGRRKAGLLKRAALVALLAISFVVLAGCGDETKTSYTLYYTNSSASALMEYSYEPKEQTTQAMAVEIYNQMRDVSISGAQTVVPSGVELEKVTLDGDIINLYFSKGLASATNSERLIFASAVTKAISALPDVSGVRILGSNGDALEGLSSFGEVLRPADFANNANDDGDDYIDATLTLYFADADKDSLVKTQKDVSYRSTTSVERVVVESIISGPEGSGLYATVSSKLTLLNISVQNGTCYVNLSKEFLTDPMTSFDQVPVYSIVNSLCELSNINSVQISINGDTSSSMPMGDISLASTFSFNSEIVIK